MTTALKPVSLTILFFSLMFNLFGQTGRSNIDGKFKNFRSKIFPIIKLSVETKDGDTVRSLKMGDEPVYKAIGGDLLCFYGIDRGNYVELIKKSDLPETIDISALDQIAQENLLRLLEGKIRMQKAESNVIGFTCGGAYEATLITSPEIWETVVSQLGPKVVFAIPAKDVVVYTSAENEAGIEGLKEMVKSIHDGGDQLLSTHLYTYSQGLIRTR